ncbi:hypothetical protein Cgig2_021310 [Carnegiea gigantea]|uniref:Uncharacterized protein n=1 Tax=Carnegiea gigantea TaxID=171969 RepID=A0A9Q1KJ71_9CARY|nr:hypothetical protein Cgig2_021310 [Carnegiea gigantea]
MTTGVDIEDVACEGDEVGNHSNIVTLMKRWSRSQKLATRDITKGMMAAEMACADSDPCERSVGLEVYLKANYVRFVKLMEQWSLNAVRHGRGPEGMHAKASTCELVEGSHQCGSKGRSWGQVREVIVYNKAHISGKIWDSFKLAPHVDLRYRIALGLAFRQPNTYADAAQWEVVTPECLERRKYV